MISKTEIIVFLYSITNSGFKIWLMDNNLKLFVPDNKKLSQEQSEFIRNNKDKIIEILHENKIFNKEYEILILSYTSDQYPLSFGQSRLLFVNRYEEGSSAYNIPMLFKLLEDTDLEILERSLYLVVKNHLILNTIIREDSNGNSYQTLIDEQKNPFTIKKYKINKAVLDSTMLVESNHLFDLSHEHPIKISFYITQDCTYLSIVVNHIAFDGWSLGIFLNELQNYYHHYLTNKPLIITDHKIQYKDFAFWQLNWTQSIQAEEQLAYWVSKLDSYQNINLATDKIRPAKIDYQGQDFFFEIDEINSKLLRKTAQNLNVSLYSLLLSAYYLMLHAYSGQDDIVVGTTSANRHHPELQGIIGCFINSLALRVNIDQQSSLFSFIKSVWDEVASAQIRQDLPFEKIVDELDVPKDMSRHPIFQVMFVMQTHTQDLEQQNLITNYKSDKPLYKIAKFDLSAFVYDVRPNLKINFNYATSLFSQDKVQRFSETYLHILYQIINYKDKLQQVKLASIEFIDFKQQKILQWSLNNGIKQNNNNIIKLFEEQVNKTPDKIALRGDNTELSYNQLNKMVNQFSHYLKQNFEIKPDDLFVVCLNRSIDLLVAIIAILKCGAAYVPIDPSYPEDRKKFIIEDTEAIAVINHDLFNEIDLSNFSADNPQNYISNSSLAYVIYTSGTTGTPKGVMIEHKSVVNYILNVAEHVKMSNDDIVDFSTNIGFDLTVTTTITALCIGAQVAVYQKDIYDLEQYKQHLIDQKITLIKLVPSYFELLVEFLPQTKIKKVMLGGEKLKTILISKIEKIASNLDLIVYDEYGPTETTVGSLISIVYPERNFTIGKPYDNYQTYILDEHLRILPIGAIGELYIGGIGLARGYLNRPELTAKKFIKSPFNPNLKIYRTGDLVCWKEDGNIEYIGRNDDQIKLRGYRIELSEIESVLQTHLDIEKAVVIVNKDHNEREYIIAYFTAGEFVPTTTELKEFLEEKLPEYMIPNYFMFVENFPLTANAKLNYKALPNPLIKKENNYFAPRNNLETQVAKIWAEVLRIDPEKLSIRDDFFMLGGDSIISIQLVSRLRQKLELLITIKDIFQYRTIERLFDHVVGKNINKVKIVSEQGTLSGPVNLLPIQEWFFDHYYPFPNHWNQVLLIKVPNLEIKRLRQSLEKLMNYHDAFRLRFKLNENGNYEQYYDAQAANEIELKTFDLNDIPGKENNDQFQAILQELYTNWQNNFDIVKGPICAIGYVHGFSDGSNRIFLATHRQIIDMVSWRILVEDIESLYNGNELVSKGSSYRQWSDTLNKYETIYPNERKYWQGVIGDYDHEQLVNFKVNDKTNNLVKIDLSLDYTDLLLKKSNYTFNTQINDLLLVAFSYALNELTGNIKHHILLEGHGREEIDHKIDISRTMGWFSSLYPVRLNLAEDMVATIKAIKENLRSIPNKGIGYGALFRYKLDSIPKICFNYHGQFDRDVKQEGWKITRERKGIQIHPNNNGQNIIDVNGSIIENILQFNFSGKISETNLKILAKSFKRNLEKVIDFTSQTNRTYLTLSDIENIITVRHLDKLQEEKEIEAIYLANSLQQGFIYHSLNQGDVDDAYIVQIMWEYHAPVNANLIKQAWELAQQKFPSLRIRFDWQEELIQIIDKNAQLKWNFIDISDQSPEQQSSKLQKIKEQDRIERYNLDQSGLFRIYLIKQNESLYTCLFSSHHSIIDGWSNPVLLKYIHDVYFELLNNEASDRSIDHSYKDSQQYLQNYRYETETFWQEYLSKIEEHADLSGLLAVKENIHLKNYKHIIDPQEKSIIVEKDLYHLLKKISASEGVTLNSILQYVWHKVLSIYSNSKQTIVGTTISGRNIPIDNIENSVGLYINTLPLIFNHDNERILKQINRLSNDINELNTRSNQSLNKLQLNGIRLFENLFVYENFPRASKNVVDKLKINFIGGKEKLDYPLAVIAFELNEKVIFKIKYAGELFAPETIDNLLEEVSSLLEQIANKPEITPDQLKYITKGQYKEISNDWNSTEAEFPYNITIIELFEKQVLSQPNATAVTYENRRLTYKELNERVNNLAHYLINSYSIEPDSLIALCLDRSEAMLISILAILKSGAGYLPIDPSYPQERKNFIINDAKVLTIITDELFKKLDLSSYSSSNPVSKVGANNLAYVIYTSGTTGNPKGVMVEHQSLVNRLNWMNKAYPLNVQDVILQKTPYVFDVSVWELLWPICYGASIVFAKPEGHKDPDYLIDLINSNNISVIHFVPSMLKIFLDRLESKKSELSSLRYVFASGEELKLSHVELFKLILPKVSLQNLYGPTECTIDVLSYSCDEITNKVYIGKPIDNTKALILNTNLQILPIGAIGELYIGGVGVARGYLNREELTNEKFILYTDLDGKCYRLYKTGDLVRYADDGNIEYLGRNDFQVKIRGYRIEIKEIESILSKYEGITENVVIAKTREDGSKYLVAYYCAKDKLDENQIIQYLIHNVPEYMLPSRVIYLPEFPLTINGKLDRNLLPDIENLSNSTFKAPNNDFERKICQIWADILEINYDEISVDDNFFFLGGDSILAIKLMVKLNKSLGIFLSLAEVIGNATIEKLANYIANSAHKNYELLIQKQKNLKKEEQLLSFAQTRLWFINHFESNGNNYNIPMYFRLNKDINLNKLEYSIQKIIDRHEILRTVIIDDKNGNLYQQVKARLFKLELNLLDNSNSSIENELKKLANYAFDLTNDFPIKASLYQYKDDFYLAIVVHHIAFDGWSIGVFLKELEDIYTGNNLSELEIQYLDFAIWQRNYLKGKILEQELEYWHNKLIGYQPLNIVTDYLRPKNFNYKGKNYYCLLPSYLSNELRTIAKKENVSLYSLMLSAYLLMLKIYSFQDDIIVGSPVANRNYPNLEKLIGFLLTQYALDVKFQMKVHYMNLYQWLIMRLFQLNYTRIYLLKN